MKLIIDIPDEQIEKSLKESEYVLEDEGIKGFVNIVMLYTNRRLEFVDIERREDFCSCNFTPLPKGHGRLIDAEELLNTFWTYCHEGDFGYHQAEDLIKSKKAIIEADKAESEDKE